jgi:WD40 repeat protein
VLGSSKRTSTSSSCSVSAIYNEKDVSNINIEIRSEADNSNIHIYDGRSDGKPLHTISKMHSKPVHLIEFNARFDTVVSVDSLGMVEYWSPEEPFGLPDNLNFEMKSQTDLYEFRKVIRDK